MLRGNGLDGGNRRPVENNLGQAMTQRGKGVAGEDAAIEYRGHGNRWVVALRLVDHGGEPARAGIGRGIRRADQAYRRVCLRSRSDGGASLPQIVDRDGFWGAAQPNFPMATAVSDIRLENPHSLSYHDSTRTNWPSMT